MSLNRLLYQLHMKRNALGVHGCLYVIHVGWEEEEGEKTGSVTRQHLFSSDIFILLLIFIKRLTDDEYDLISDITMPISYIIRIRLKTEGTFCLVFHNRDHFIVTICAWGGIHSRYRNRAVERKEEESGEMNRVGKARGLCEEQMVSGCKHISTLISREAQWGDISIFLLTIRSLFVRDSPTHCVSVGFLLFYNAPVCLWCQTIFNSHNFNTYLLWHYTL